MVSYQDWKKIFRYRPLIKLDEYIGFKSRFWKERIAHSNWGVFWKRACYMDSVTKVDVPVLQVGRVEEQDGAEVAGGRGGIDGAAKSIFHQGRQVAAMVDVGVRDQAGVDVRWVEGQVAVTFEGLFPATLVETAVEQNTLPGHL